MENNEAMETKKRTRRTFTKEEKIEALNAKIAKYEAAIAELKSQIEALNKPSVTIKDLANKIKENNIPIDDVMKAVDKLAKKNA